ncbi:MAG TPA: acyl-CoA dehydrogenase [Rhodospirillales bacterium]|nr:acyl-CoA dehydrogenase [Rhodospirillales bacterium]
MEFQPSDEQSLLVSTLRRFIGIELHPLEDIVEQTGELAVEDAERILKNSRDLGFYAMNIPEQHGGGGLSTLDWMLVEEQFGYTTDILIRRAFGNVYEILLAGTPEQQERWLLPSVKGRRTFSIAFTEPEAGSDAASIRTAARQKGDSWILSGQKCFISDAHFSDFFVATAVTDQEAAQRGISTFIVDKGLEGFTIGPDQPMMGLRGTTHADLFFDDVKLGPETLLGPEGDGLKLALETLGRVRLAQIGARAIGKATRILDLTIEHARQRKQFGSPIGEFQMIQKMLADSAMEIKAARLALYATACLIDRGNEAREEISMVKVQASETLGRVVDRAVQIFGGSGYAKGLPIERYYRDARIYRIFDGTSEIHRTVIAKALLKGAPQLYDLAAQ